MVKRSRSILSNYISASLLQALALLISRHCSSISCAPIPHSCSAKNLAYNLQLSDPMIKEVPAWLCYKGVAHPFYLCHRWRRPVTVPALGQVHIVCQSLSIIYYWFCAQPLSQCSHCLWSVWQWQSPKDETHHRRTGSEMIVDADFTPDMLLKWGWNHFWQAQETNRNSFTSWDLRLRRRKAVKSLTHLEVMIMTADVLCSLDWKLSYVKCDLLHELFHQALWFYLFYTWACEENVVTYKLMNYYTAQKTYFYFYAYYKIRLPLLFLRHSRSAYLSVPEKSATRGPIEILLQDLLWSGL